MSKTHWTAYWKTGVMTSLPSDFKKNYDGELIEYWRGILRSAESPVNILDVCTGNGAVAIILSELADELNMTVSITGVDASNINPEDVLVHNPDKAQTLSKIKFVGNTMVENLAEQFDEKYDLIVSQYGIEYCETLSAANNIAEMLKPMGRLVFVAHSPDTAMLSYMQTESAAFDVLEFGDVFDSFKRYSEGKLSVNGFKLKLKEHMQHLSQQTELRQHDLIRIWGNNMYQLYQMKNNELKSQRNNVQKFLQHHLYARARAHDMLTVSDKLINQPKWYQAFENVGLKLVDDGEINYRNLHNVGHSYEFVNNKIN